MHLAPSAQADARSITPYKVKSPLTLPQAQLARGDTTPQSAVTASNLAVARARCALLRACLRIADVSTLLSAFRRWQLHPCAALANNSVHGVGEASANIAGAHSIRAAKKPAMANPLACVQNGSSAGALLLVFCALSASTAPRRVGAMQLAVRAWQLAIHLLYAEELCAERLLERILLRSPCTPLPPSQNAGNTIHTRSMDLEDIQLTEARRSVLLSAVRAANALHCRLVQTALWRWWFAVDSMALRVALEAGQCDSRRFNQLLVRTHAYVISRLLRASAGIRAHAHCKRAWTQWAAIIEVGNGCDNLVNQWARVADSCSAGLRTRHASCTEMPLVDLRLPPTVVPSAHCQRGVTHGVIHNDLSPARGPRTNTGMHAFASPHLRDAMNDCQNDGILSAFTESVADVKDVSPASAASFTTQQLQMQLAAAEAVLGSTKQDTLQAQCAIYTEVSAQAPSVESLHPEAHSTTLRARLGIEHERALQDKQRPSLLAMQLREAKAEAGCAKRSETPALLAGKEADAARIEHHVGLEEHATTVVETEARLSEADGEASPPTCESSYISVPPLGWGGRHAWESLGAWQAAARAALLAAVQGSILAELFDAAREAFMLWQAITLFSITTQRRTSASDAGAGR